MAELVVRELHKYLGGNHVLKGVSLQVEPGEVVALLGQSGSGKTTILRSVAGLEVPDSGRIELSGQVVFDAAKRVIVPPEKRGVGLVFQSYALWPNRTVFDNVAYGLKLRRRSAAEIDATVSDMLARLGLGDLSARFPHQLSGGQQQRVALARALAYRPPLLLLDEPLSNLDAKLREEARVWLRQLIIEARIGALYVTHDQVEAMAVADRLLLLSAGTVEQEGAPRDVYERPATALSAHFMGNNNTFEGVIGEPLNGQGVIRIGDGALRGRMHGTLAAGDAAVAYVRIERTRVGHGRQANSMEMDLATSIYLGERLEHLFTRGKLRARVWSTEPLEPGAYHLDVNPDDVWIFPASG